MRIYGIYDKMITREYRLRSPQEATYIETTYKYKPSPIYTPKKHTVSSYRTQQRNKK